NASISSGSISKVDKRSSTSSYANSPFLLPIFINSSFTSLNPCSSSRMSVSFFSVIKSPPKCSNNKFIFYFVLILYFIFQYILLFFFFYLVMFFLIFFLFYNYLFFFF